MSINALTCDVLVVGGGPAGSCAARTAAKAGAEVIVAEQRLEIGQPVQCAEYIPKPLLGHLGLGRDFVVQHITGMKTFLPDGQVTLTQTPGYTIHRNAFDATLARAAMDEGARYMLGYRAQAVTINGSVLLGRKGGGMARIEPKIIVGADGPRSVVGKRIGSSNTNLLPGVQMTLELTRQLEHTEIYFDQNFYAGYGWLFPKGPVANIGLGIQRQEDNKVNPRALLEDFVNRLRNEGRVKGEPVGFAAGWIPAEPVRSVVRGNILLAGDAAGQTHPITGAGVSAAVQCGEMAGEWAARAALENDVELLKGYDEEWRDMFENTQTRAHSRRQLMEAQWDDLDNILPRCWVAFRDYYAAP